MSDAAASADATALSLEQQLQSLWSDATLNVFAVILGNRVPQLAARLNEADIEDWDLLWTGELEAAERAAAPHLVHLRRTSVFTDWLLREAGAAHGAWGLLLRSRRPFLAMRTHGRALCEASLADGSALRLDWADAEVLGAVLPLCAPYQLQPVFAPLESIVVTGPTEWTRWSLDLGRLQTQRSGVQAR